MNKTINNLIGNNRPDLINSLQTITITPEIKIILQYGLKEANTQIESNTQKLKSIIEQSNNENDVSIQDVETLIMQTKKLQASVDEVTRILNNPVSRDILKAMEPPTIMYNQTQE